MTFMKSVITLIFAAFVAFASFAKVPLAIAYQTCILNSSGKPATTDILTVTASIVTDTTSSAVALYSETHDGVEPNANGLISLVIGKGTAVSGSMESIDLTKGPYFVKISTDKYGVAGISQLASFPYASHAMSADNFPPKTTIDSALCTFDGTNWVARKPAKITLGIAGGSQPHNNMQPSLTINYYIATQGIFPSQSTTPFIGQIELFCYSSFNPAGYVACDGSLLSISDHYALFALIGTTFGGDGQSTFAVPDLRGRVPINQGNNYIIGQSGGAENVVLTIQNLPMHNHNGTVVYE